MADHQQAAAVVLQVVAEPDDRIGVQVVGGLVEQERLGVAEQDAGKLDAPALAAGEGVQRLVEHPVGQPQARGHRGRLGLGSVPAEHGQPVAEVAVPPDRLVRLDRVRVRHQRLGLAHVIAHLVQAAGGEDPVEREHVKIAGPRVLREVADGPGMPNGPGGGLAVARQDLSQGGLARAVAADETDTVPLGNLERGVCQQEPGTRTQLNATGDDHR